MISALIKKSRHITIDKIETSTFVHSELSALCPQDMYKM